MNKINWKINKKENNYKDSRDSKKENNLKVKVEEGSERRDHKLLSLTKIILSTLRIQKLINLIANAKIVVRV
jgi:hypothetical protein